MKKVLLFILSIPLLSCGGNGNKSARSQEVMDMDSDSVAIDTMVNIPVKDEISEEPIRQNLRILLLEHSIVPKVEILMSSTMIIQECSLQEVEVEQHTIGV